MADSVLRSLADRSLALDALIETENQHRQISEDDTFAFVERMKNSNTKKKTDYDVKKLQQWLSETGEYRCPEDIPPKDLNFYLARMILSIKKPNGDEYEPDSLRSIYSSIHRHLTTKHYRESIMTSAEFKHARDVLASKKKSLKQQGLGNKKRLADPFTDDEINVLRKKQLLGSGKYNIRC